MSSINLKLSYLVFLIFLPLTILSSSVTANDNEQAYESPIVEAELAQTLAPIALYPDTLLTHILIAATYPIEVIEAERWLKKKAGLSAKKIAKKAETKDWDASVKALLAFPRVMGQLSDDLTWMQKLGDAFLLDEARVMASIQTLRRQADYAGSLAKMDNVEVIKDRQVIIIEPAQPEVIYVPYYDTRVVYGHWHWSHYPPIYWHHPHHYAAHYGHFYWGHGVRISTHFFFSAFHWHNRHVVVSHYNRHRYHSRKKIVTSHHAKRWQHQPKHRRGVAYSSGGVKKKYYNAGPTVHHNKVVKSQNVVNQSRYIKSAQKNKMIKQHNKQVKVKKHSKVKPHSSHNIQSTRSKSKQHKQAKVTAHNKSGAYKSTTKAVSNKMPRSTTSKHVTKKSSKQIARVSKVRTNTNNKAK